MKADAFRDQVVIITGASSGIGRALALQLAGQGAKVVLAARRAELLGQVADSCRQAGGQALAVQTDVADEAQCKALIEKAVTTFGRLDMLVNNAGLAVIARLEDYTDLSLFQHTMNVNFYGAVYCTYYALPHLIRSRGRIAAVSSLGGKAPLPYNSPYIASKTPRYSEDTGVRSADQVTASIFVLFGPEDLPHISPGDVLVAVTTTPAWTSFSNLSCHCETSGGWFLPAFAGRGNLLPDHLALPTSCSQLIAMIPRWSLAPAGCSRITQS